MKREFSLENTRNMEIIVIIFTHLKLVRHIISTQTILLKYF